ncbi:MULTISPECIES: metal-dependent hydrolase family protein [Croceibacter]|mgnify:CR=1 FL=1|uniref:metal-dependent hydrolase family protein n=1 Tax=Croceibacter TaxID=216431 RepID=UPI000C3DD2BF|nr:MULTISPECIES: amidohydrolase family protein [Croceibacter]MBG26961.1 amidohydrolase [Croceibacter sp.]|tara:strand:+ start:9485 stop:10765 length:1281 start_codon:yes stop_codon:yes gene_type:complete
MKRLILLLLIFSCASIFAQNTYIHCGKLFNSETAKIETEKTIVVKGDKIDAILQGYAQPKNADAIIINLKDKTVLPGLIDMHVHIESETGANKYLEPFVLNEADVAYNAQEIAQRTLMAGFTTVRDLGGTGVNVSLRNAINQGKVQGPRILTAEKALGTTGGHADPTNGRNKELIGDPGPKEGVVNGVRDARKAVRQRYKNGADWIKITATGGVLSVAKSSKNPQFTDEEIAEICNTAADYGMKVAAHAHGDKGMQRAINNGVKTIEHGTLMSDETMDIMKEKNSFLVPTISAGKYVSEKAKIKDYYPAIIVPKALEIGPKIQDMFGRAYKRGVPIAFGTDAGVFPHGENAKEFMYMVEAGMPEHIALQTATFINAEVLEMPSQIGQLKKGAFADIIAVNEDPTKTITAMQNVSFVMKGGTVYKKE